MNKINQIINGLTLNTFVDVTNNSEIINELFLNCTIVYNDFDIIIYKYNNEDAYLIEYNKKYYMCIDVLDYIIIHFKEMIK